MVVAKIIRENRIREIYNVITCQQGKVFIMVHDHHRTPGTCPCEINKPGRHVGCK